MRKIFLCVLLCTGLFSVASAEQPRPEMARYTKAYSGGDGYQVWLARVGPKENNEVLIQIVGIDHKLDGKVIRAKATSVGGGLKYTATIDGKPLDLLYVQGDSAELRLTGQPWTSTLSYDRELVSNQPPQHLLTAFLEQK